MVYWLSFATALPVATLVSLWMAMTNERLGFDTVVMCWLVGLWGGWLFGLVFYHDAFNPWPAILVSVLFPPLLWWRLEVKGSESLEPRGADATWSRGFLIAVGVATVGVLVFGAWIRRSQEFVAAGMPPLLFAALMFANACTAIFALWLTLQAFRQPK